jgi:hypothetical protein
MNPLRLVYLPDTVDCTADPHPVLYGDSMHKVVDDIIKVCASSLVKAIRNVRLQYDMGQDVREEYESDDYEDIPPHRQPLKVATGPEAEKYKVAGLYFYEDAQVDPVHHLPIGLEGVKAAVEIIKQRWIERKQLPSGLTIRVVWAFADSSSCSDNIDAEFHGGLVTVDYSNQDWWTTKNGYSLHCAALSELIGQEIEPNSGDA